VIEIAGTIAGVLAVIRFQSSAKGNVMRYLILIFVLCGVCFGLSSLKTSTVFHKDDCSSIQGKDPNRIEHYTYAEFTAKGKTPCKTCSPQPEAVVLEPAPAKPVQCQLQRWSLVTRNVADPIAKDGDIVMLSVKGIPAFNRAYYDKRMKVLEWLVTPLEAGMYYPQAECIMHEIKVDDQLPTAKQVCGLLQAGLRTNKLTYGGYMTKFAEYANRYNKLIALDPPAKIKSADPNETELLEILKALAEGGEIEE